MKILIFTGAGISRQFGLPTTPEFLKEFKNQKNSWDVFTKALLNHGYPDIEYVLKIALDIKKLKNSLGGEFVSQVEINDGERVFQGPSFLNSLGLLDKEIMEYLFKKYQLKDNEKNNLKNFYKKFFDLIKKYNDNKIEIITTNYDTSIEKFCGLIPDEFTCIDGFSKGKSYFAWNPEVWDRTYVNQDTPVFLHKIHGSLNWHKYNETFIKVEAIDYVEENENGGSALIAPTIDPKDADVKEPFKTLFNLFVKKLNEADVCIIIGSSFRDRVFNKYFEEFIRGRKHMIIISPSAYQNYTKGLMNQSINDETVMVEWAKENVRTNQWNVEFLPKGVKQENNDEIFKKLESKLEKIL